MIRDTFAMPSPFALIATMMALLLAMLIGMLDPFIGAGIIGILTMGSIIALRWDQLAATLVVVVSLYVDWYLGMKVAALVVVLALLFIFFMTRSPERPWLGPRALWLWMLLLVLAIPPATRGFTWNDGVTYYLNVFFGPAVIFWLGAVIARDIPAVRRFVQLLAGLGALLAVHTLVQAFTGILLFRTSRYDAFLAQVSGFELAGSTATRVGSFFLDPNWNGAFFAMMLFLPIGLFFNCTSLGGKILYLIEICLMCISLLFIFSNGAWVGAFAGTLTLLLLVGRMRYRVLILLIVFGAATAVALVFPTQLALEIQHATGATEVVSRTSAWQTAINVIHAFPLTGIGLGLLSYLNRAEPYRVIAQYVPLAHPHDSYLELAAMAGLPVLLVFAALLSFAFSRALRNWARADARTRSLLAGGIAAAAALSVNSISINGWTLSPLAATGWLILGAISSPLIAKGPNREASQEKDDAIIEAS